MLTSCTWQRRSAPRCVRRRVLPHGSDFTLAVASVPAPSLDETCTQSLDPCACGVEPSLHRDRLNFGIQTASISRVLLQEVFSNAIEPKRIPEYFLAGSSLTIYWYTIVENGVLRSRTVSTSGNQYPSVQTEFSNAIGHRHIAVLPLPTRKDANPSVSRQSCTPVDIVSVAKALRKPNSATSRHASVPSAYLKR